MFEQICSSGGNSPQDGNTRYYCKLADGAVTRTLDHNKEVNGANSPRQVVFIRPPSYNYVHNVNLRGNPGQPQQTEIYVLPSNADHNVNLNPDIRTAEGSKPSVSFLTSDQSGGQQGGSNSGFITSGSVGSPQPVGRFPNSGSSNPGPLRPSAPPPNPSNPNVVGIDATAVIGGYNGGSSNGNYDGNYGPPSLSPRNNRNTKQFVASGSYRV